MPKFNGIAYSRNHIGITKACGKDEAEAGTTMKLKRGVLQLWN